MKFGIRHKLGFKRVVVILVTLLCIGFALAALNSIPLSAIIPPLKNNEVSSLYIEIFMGGEADSEAFIIESPDIIEKIVGRMKDIRLSYRGPYQHLTYGEYDNDWIIIIHVEGRENRVYLKESGEIYSQSNRYVSRQSSGAELFYLILELMGS